MPYTFARPYEIALWIDPVLVMIMPRPPSANATILVTGSRNASPGSITVYWVVGVSRDRLASTLGSVTPERSGENSRLPYPAPSVSVGLVAVLPNARR